MSGGNQERWLLTYSDLITLLMVFFVVMYAISEADKGKFIQLRSSMQKAFTGESVGGSEGSQILDGKGTALLDGLEARPPAAVQEGAGNAPAVSRSSSAAAEAGVILDQIREVILPLAEQEGVAESVHVYRVPEGVMVSLSGNLLFDSGKAELRLEGVTFLHALAEVVQTLTNHLRVEGHTDDVPIHTSLYPSNWELSSARAIVAARYLVEQEKLPAGRVATAAYGEHRPVADNGTRAGRARNRRVDVLIYAPASATTGTSASPSADVNRSAEDASPSAETDRGGSR